MGALSSSSTMSTMGSVFISSSEKKSLVVISRPAAALLPLNVCKRKVAQARPF